MGRYHFIAIGGIGMSGLAKYLLEDGHTVSGSDIADSKYIDKLRELGAQVKIGHNEANLSDDTDIVVISTAIRENNPELVKARQLGIPVYHRSDLLEEIAKTAQQSGKCFIGFPVLTENHNERTSFFCFGQSRTGAIFCRWRNYSRY